MPLIARTLRFLTSRYLTRTPRSNQVVARANAARASATLRERRHERDAVDAYVQAKVGDDR
jgi:hypothetical protein